MFVVDSIAQRPSGRAPSQGQFMDPNKIDGPDLAKSRLKFQVKSFHVNAHHPCGSFYKVSRECVRKRFENISFTLSQEQFQKLKLLLRHSALGFSTSDFNILSTAKERG